jgi:hypothetical protein
MIQILYRNVGFTATDKGRFNSLNPELNPICYLLAFFYFSNPARFSRENKLRKLKVLFFVA